MVPTRSACAGATGCQAKTCCSCRVETHPPMPAVPRSCQGRPGCSPDESGCSPEEAAAADLRYRYTSLLAGSLGNDLWRHVWHLFLTHDWFQAKLDMCARMALRSSGMSPQWIDDVKQEVIVRLAHKCRRVPDLHLDVTRPGRQFGGWLYTILLRDCQQVIRTLRRLHCRTVELFDNYAVSDRASKVDAGIDFEDALGKLEDPELTVVAMYRQGYTVQEIADSLGFSGSKTYRTLNRGMSRLARRLGKPSLERETSMSGARRDS